MPDRHKYQSIAFAVLVLLGLYVMNLHGYILFHSLAEIFAIVVACGIFMVAWNSFRFIDNNYLLFIGIAYLFVGGLDMVHTLAYPGMGVFRESDTNLAVQLWIAARGVESISLLVAHLFLGRKLKVKLVLGGYAVIFTLLLGSIFYWNVFPVCFVGGVGLTPFKKISEYVISMVLAASCAVFFKKRQLFDMGVLRLLVASIIVTIASELAFTFYTHAYGFFNLVGHFLKIISFYLIYKAIVETALARPYDLVFRDLKQSENSLRQARHELERRVEARSAELVAANEQLKQEVEERKGAEGALRESEKIYSRLVENSLIGICIILDGKIEFANNRFAQMHGYSPDELIGMESLKLVHPDDRSLVQEIRRKRFNGEEAPSEYEAMGLTKDGETIWTIRRFSQIEYKGSRAILGNVADITQRKWMQEALLESERDLRLLSSHLLTAEEKERKRIAQELHDGIGQSLSAIKFSLEGTLEQMGQEETGAADAKSLYAIVPIIQEAIEEVRRIVMNLRPSTLDDLGILATIAWFSREFESVYSGIRIQKEIEIKEEDIPEHLKPVIYRVLQEALNNVAKHSRADFVRLCLRKIDGTIELDIEDNGCGFDPIEASSVGGVKKGFGLLSMRERIQLSGGVHTVKSTGVAGTIVRASWLCETC